MKRKNRLFVMLLTVLLSSLMVIPVFAKEKSGVDDGAVRRTKQEVEASKNLKEILDEGIDFKAVPDENLKIKDFKNPLVKEGVDDGAVRRTKEEVEGKCGVDDGAARRTKEEMKLQNNSGLTDAQKFYVGIMAGLTIITVALSLYIIYGKDKKIDE